MVGSNRIRGWLAAVVLVLTPGCTFGDLPAGGAAGEERMDQDPTERLFQRIDQQLARPVYDFSLAIDSFEFTGQQKGENWSLQSKHETEKPVRVVKKGNTITLTHGDQTEKLKTRQFGLLSPRDHLELVKASVLRVKLLPPDPKDGTKGMKAVLSSEEIGDKLGHWMGHSFESGAAFQASRKFRVVYRFRYHPREEGLDRLTLRIEPLKGKKGRQKIEYRFEKP
ncbi:hypothetical protein C8P63_11093 [Melghirimyces profundicolus]|uniref:Outer membrane lipoprotein-sorting protein n=1 Tax=Melghirimyces profundicolus TaxID=1242148 RepID=A0A2T6BV44_9BACL|nr:hypothetical protein [Melghirimyces profundicolus]PTX59948.1 hypothetical protein C8P63_11093 [Melghirimyces profundicolus]